MAASSMIDAPTLEQKLRDRLEKKTHFSLVDLRNEADYQKGHILGAQNVPLKKLRFVAEKMFGPTEEIIFYGHSRNDNASTNALILLGQKGFENVRLLEGGIQEWKGDMA